MTQTLYLQLIFAALYNPEKFIEFARGNKGYAFALDMLGGLESIDSGEDFQYFLDSVVDAKTVNPHKKLMANQRLFSLSN